MVASNHPNKFESAKYHKLFDVTRLDLGLNSIIDDVDNINILRVPEF